MKKKPRAKPHKYRVNPPELRRADGITFDSTLERNRYLVLKDKERKREISGLELQPVFPLIVNGKEIGKYKADFRYQDRSGQSITEDAKGMRTALYRLKKKIVEAQYGITITEITKKTLGK